MSPLRHSAQPLRGDAPVHQASPGPTLSPPTVPSDIPDTTGVPGPSGRRAVVMGRAGWGAGEPGPASGVAASGTQCSPRRGGSLPAPEAASELARGYPPASFWEGVEKMTKKEALEEENMWRRAGKVGAKSDASTRRPQVPYFATFRNSTLGAVYRSVYCLKN